MNLFQRIAALCGRQYVVLQDFDGTITVRPAKFVGPSMIATRWAFGINRCLLKPNGKLDGPCYVNSWAPLTDKALCHFYAFDERDSA